MHSMLFLFLFFLFLFLFLLFLFLFLLFLLVVPIPVFVVPIPVLVVLYFVFVGVIFAAMSKVKYLHKLEYKNKFSSPSHHVVGPTILMMHEVACVCIKDAHYPDDA